MSVEATRPRIVVAEDDPMVLELINTRLELAGFRTFTARNGTEALSRIAHVRPDGLVLDINMPVLDGFQVLERLKMGSSVHRTPTLVLTARNRPEDVKRAIELGARDFIAKPFKDDQLIARVHRLVRKVKPADVIVAPDKRVMTIEI